MIIKESSRRRPKVLPWWFAFCFLAVGVYGLQALSSVLQIAASDRGSYGTDVGAVIITIGVQLVFALAYGIGPFLPRRRATWVFGIIQLAFSLLCSCGICLPLSVPLLIFWCRQDTRDWFDRRETEKDLATVFD